MDILVCPVCSSALLRENSSYRCENGHSFDIAKEGYVNLLSGRGRNGSLIGDNRDMAKSRRAFLEKGYYAPFAGAVVKTVSQSSPQTVLDICCGEGYYTQMLAENMNTDVYGFDISKEMIRLAAKRKCGCTFFVAGISDIPVKKGSIDAAVHLFAPFNEASFAPLLSDSGLLISAVSGKEHLFGLKKAMYDEPYYNTDTVPHTESLVLEDKINVKYDISLTSNGDIMSLLKMTPYYYRTSPRDIAKLEKYSELETVLDFELLIFRRKK